MSEIQTSASSPISAEVAAAYANTMLVAQQLEHSMRIILFVGDKYALLPKLKLTRRERTQFADIQSFLDSGGTAGRLLNALVEAGLLKKKSGLESALKVRNELAHWFLLQKCSGARSKLKDGMALEVLRKANRKLSQTLKQVELIQAKLERQADEHHLDFQRFVASLRLDWSVGDRERYMRKKAPSL